MDKLSYLKSISADNRPVKSSSSLFSSKPLRIGLISTFILTLIIIITGIFSQLNSKPRDLLIRAHLRSNNLISTLHTYTPKVKSSTLRSLGLSLSSVLTAASNKIQPILTSEFEYKEPEPNLLAEETTTINQFNTTLESAELNGRLDRVYIQELTLQIALLRSLELEIRTKTDSKPLKAILTSSIDNLTELHQKFSSFSDSSL